MDDLVPCRSLYWRVLQQKESLCEDFEHSVTIRGQPEEFFWQHIVPSGTAGGFRLEHVPSNVYLLAVRSPGKERAVP